jgi:hypothetical protein
MNITNENNIKKVKKNKSLLVDKNVKIIELNDDLELELINIQKINEEKKESNDNIMNIINKETKKVREMGLDKFYTKKNISKMCIDLVDKEYKLETFDLIIEPSAGNGSFLEQIKHKNIIGIDISPENDKIIKKDFLKYNPDKKYNNILTIGNPPFGKISSLAIKFFNHASEWSNVIAFIIPKTFRRISVQNNLNLNFHLLKDIEIPNYPCSFEPPMSVKCCFQIWIKKNKPRKEIILDLTHDDWEFIPFGPKDDNGQPTPPKNVDFALRAYGGKCGEIFEKNLSKLRPKSYHWIKSNIDKKKLIERFKSLDYSISFDTARQNSIGKAELVKLYSDKFN